MCNGTSGIGIVEQKVRLYEHETETWLNDHQAAILCFDLEELVGDGVHFFESINRLDENWRGFVFDNPSGFNEDIDRQILQFYQRWLTSSKKILEIFEQLKEEYNQRDFDMSLVSRLQSCCREAEGVVADSATYFSSGHLASLKDAAIDEYEAGEAVEMNVFGE